jgi:hypothetical protein
MSVGLSGKPGSPFRLGPFVVDDAGRLSPGAAERSPTFRVCWRDRVVHVHPPAPGATQGSPSVQAVLGRIPSTAGPDAATAPARRAEAFAVLHSLRPVLPAGWKISLFADHRVGLELTLGLQMPATAAGLVTAMTLFLLELAPYLDVLEAAGVAAVPAVGTANAWPG